MRPAEQGDPRADTGELQPCRAAQRKRPSLCARGGVVEVERERPQDGEMRLAEGDRTLVLEPGAPNVWLFVGVNGVGKTTTIGKVGKQQIGRASCRERVLPTV